MNVVDFFVDLVLEFGDFVGMDVFVGYEGYLWDVGVGEGYDVIVVVGFY